MFVRTTVSDDPIFIELAKRVHNIALEANRHKSLPFGTLIKLLQSEEMLLDSCFQVVFEFRNPSCLEVTPTPLLAKYITAPPDLVLSISEADEGLSCNWQYNTDLFLESTVQRIANHFQNLLLGISASPSQHISKIPLTGSMLVTNRISSW